MNDTRYYHTTSPHAMVALAITLIGWAFFDAGLSLGVGGVMMSVGAGLIALFFIQDLRTSAGTDTTDERAPGGEA
jgi:hypothetical protein